MKEIIKPEKIISPFCFVIVVIAVFILMAINHALIINTFETSEIKFFNEWYIITGMFLTIPSALIIGYIRLALFTRSMNLTALAEMKSLSVLAMYPFLNGVITFFLDEFFKTHITIWPMFMFEAFENTFYIPSFILDLTQLFGLLISIYFIVELYITMKKDNTLERIKEHNRSLETND